MCARYTLIADPESLQLTFPGFVFPDPLPPRYNIAPGQEIAAVANTGENRVERFRWGLVPSWAKDPKIGNRMINARSETLAEKPAFRSAYRHRRCLVIADGFYEWHQDPGAKSRTPMYIHLQSGEPFAFAGLWESWTPLEGNPLRSCTLLTTRPNELMEKIHDRMPVILPPETFERWLDPESCDPEILAPLLEPYPASPMTAYPVSKRVNNPGTDDPDCIRPDWPGSSRQPTLF